LDSLETKKGQNGEHLSRSQIASENFGGKIWREILAENWNCNGDENERPPSYNWIKL